MHHGARRAERHLTEPSLIERLRGHTRASRSRLPLVLWHAVFALLLVLAQREATLHWLGHAAVAASSHHAVAASADVCDECLALSALGHLSHPPALTLALLDIKATLVAYPGGESHVSLLQLGYASRGPPLA